MPDPEVVVRGRGDFRDLNRDIAATERRFSQMGSTIKRGLATAGIAGTAALVKLGVESVKAGSAAEQSLGATETVFGKYADTVIRRSQEAADAVGLSANEYRELANVTGGMLQNAGTPLKQVTKLTAELTKRAADMAATYGGSTKEAIESVSSLLRGEADPIERYGVSIKQSDVNARLAAQGLDKLEGSARKQAEQQARLDLLFQQTAKTAGQFGRESDTIAGKGQRLGAKVEDLEAKFSDLLIPALSAAADWASDEVVPALDDLHGWLSDNSDEFAELASTVKDSVLPVLSTTVDVVGSAVELFSDLPGPVKELAVQGGIAALVLPRLAGGMDMATVSGSKMVGTLRDAEKRTALLGSAARNVAGVGGLVALTQATDQSSESLSRLAVVGGATAVGFSVAGPWGAAVGAAGSSLAIIATEGWKSADAVQASASYAETSTAKWETYAATLDEVTGSITRQTRQEAVRRLQDEGALEIARQLGISTNDVVKASLGKEAALARVQARVTELTGVQSVYVDGMGQVHVQSTELSEEAGKLAGILHFESGAIAESTAKIREQAIASGELKRELKGVSDRGTIVSRIEMNGWPEAQREVRQLLRGIDLTPEQVKVVIEALGVGDAIRDVDRFADSVGNQAPKKAREGGRKTGKAITDGAAEGLSTAALERKLRLGVKGTTGNATKPAHTGGQEVGGNLGLGMYQGLGLWIDPLSTRAASMVRGAVEAAKAEGKISSPSRETDYVGRMLGEGLTGGMDATAPGVEVSGRRLGKDAVAGILAGITLGSDEVDKALDALTKQIEKAIKRGKGKNADKREEKREKAILKGLKDEYAALKAASAAQAEQNGYLEDARAQLEAASQAYDDYTGAIRNTIKAAGDLTQLGRQDDGTVSLTSMLDQLDSAAIKVEQFEKDMILLADRGLSQDQVEKMLAAGPEAAAATAAAIVTGGVEAVQKLNEYGVRIGDAGDRLARDMAARYGPIKGVTYQQGVEIAQNLVTGMTKELADRTAEVVAAAERLAAAIPKSVKKKLKINSPSKVFEGIGQDVVAGLTFGIDDTVAARSGASLAASLVKGFDNPQLSADVLSSGAAGRRETIRIELTAPALDRLSRGAALQADIDYARTNGVLGTTF